MYQVYNWNSDAVPEATADFERAKALAITVARNSPEGRHSAYVLVVAENEWALRFGDVGEPVKLYGSEIPEKLQRANKPG